MSYSIEEWCKRHRLSRSTYYKLVRAGQGPRSMKILDCVRIGEDADKEWVRAQEAKTNSQAVSL